MNILSTFEFKVDGVPSRIVPLVFDTDSDWKLVPYDINKSVDENGMIREIDRYRVEHKVDDSWVETKAYYSLEELLSDIGNKVNTK